MKDQIKNSIKKIQDLPLGQRKIILWTITIILGIIFIFFWWNSAKERLQKINLTDAAKEFMPVIEENNSLNQEDILLIPDFSSEEQKEEE